MNILFDTHTFIWWDNDRAKLTERARLYCEDMDNTLFVSTASIWEMQIKVQLGKLELPLPISDMVRAQVENNHVQLLSVHAQHVYGLDRLPHHHRDPFDRMLIAQANVENLTLLTNDAKIRLYPVRWAW